LGARAGSRARREAGRAVDYDGDRPADGGCVIGTDYPRRSSITSASARWLGALPRVPR
jgi:hypothetical protein